MKKRIFALLLALAMVCSLAVGVFAVESEAGSAAALSLEVTQDNGEAVVAVYLHGGDGVTNGRFTVSYDGGTLTGVQKSDAYAVGSVNDSTAVSLAWVGSKLTAAKTLMLTLRFKAAPGVVFSAESNGIYAGSKLLEVTGATAINKGGNTFEDIEGHWAEKDILKTADLGLFSGVSATQFKPNMNVTRAMFVTVLYRMAGEPTVTGTTAFDDVAADAYYADAVAWAAQCGVTEGVSETLFAPNNNITREQMMTMLYRYAKDVEGRDVSKSASLNDFTDKDNVDAWAAEAMAWAVAEGLIVGYPDGTVLPDAFATRAQLATIVCRYLGL